MINKKLDTKNEILKAYRSRLIANHNASYERGKAGDLFTDRAKVFEEEERWLNSKFQEVERAAYEKFKKIHEETGDIIGDLSCQLITPERAQERFVKTMAELAQLKGERI